MIHKNDKLKYSQMSQEEIHQVFALACHNGNLELIQYLLSDKKIKTADLGVIGAKGLTNACLAKHEHVVRFLTQGKELTQHVSMNINKGALLKIAVLNHHTELIDYFLRNKKMNLNQNNDEIFRALMWDFAYHKDMIIALILDYQLPKTQTIIDFLDEKNVMVEQKQLVRQWFEQRELKNTMQYVFDDDAKKKPLVPIKKRKI